MDCFARFFFPAPTFWDTKDAMDCISELGTSIAKLTILQASPISRRGFQTKSVDKGTECQEGKLSQELLQCKWQTNLKKSLTLWVQSEITFFDL